MVPAVAANAKLHREPEDVRRRKDAAVQRIAIGPQLGAEPVGQRTFVPERIDALQQRLERGDSASLDGRRVEERRAIVADLSRRRTGCGLLRAGKQLGHLSLRLRGDFIARRPAVAPGGQRGGLEPSAIGVGEKVVARMHGDVHAVIDAGRSLPGFRRALEDSGEKRESDAEQETRGNPARAEARPARRG